MFNNANVFDRLPEELVKTIWNACKEHHSLRQSCTTMRDHTNGFIYALHLNTFNEFGMPLLIDKAYEDDILSKFKSFPKKATLRKLRLGGQMDHLILPSIVGNLYTRRMLQTVTNVNIFDSLVKSDDLTRLHSVCPGIEILEMSAIRVAPHTLQSIGVFTGLKTLIIEDWKQSESRNISPTILTGLMPSLAGIVGLRSLELHVEHRCSVSWHHELTHLTSMTGLTELILDGHHFKVKQQEAPIVPSIIMLTTLTNLQLYINFPQDDLVAVLNSLQGLKNLSIDNVTWERYGIHKRLSIGHAKDVVINASRSCNTRTLHVVMFALKRVNTSGLIHVCDPRMPIDVHVNMLDDITRWASMSPKQLNVYSLVRFGWDHSIASKSHVPMDPCVEAAMNRFKAMWSGEFPKIHRVYRLRG
jgi:hypothetical protein